MGKISIWVEKSFESMIKGLCDMGIRKNSQLLIKPFPMISWLKKIPSNVFRIMELVLAAILEITGSVPPIIKPAKIKKFKVPLEVMQKKWGIDVIDLSNKPFRKIEYRGGIYFLPSPVVSADYILNIVPLPSQRTLILPSTKSIQEINITVNKGTLEDGIKYLLEKVITVSGVLSDSGDMLIISNLATEMDAVLASLTGIREKVLPELKRLSKIGNTNLRRTRFTTLPLFRARNILSRMIARTG